MSKIPNSENCCRSISRNLGLDGWVCLLGFFYFWLFVVVVKFFVWLVGRFCFFFSCGFLLSGLQFLMYKRALATFSRQVFWWRLGQPERFGGRTGRKEAWFETSKFGKHENRSTLYTSVKHSKIINFRKKILTGLQESSDKIHFVQLKAKIHSTLERFS